MCFQVFYIFAQNDGCQATLERVKNEEKNANGVQEL